MERNKAVDLMKGLLIILMIVGHFPMNETAFAVLYSFHMMAFVLVSGYYFKENDAMHIKTGLTKVCRAYLIPYGIFVVIYISMFHVGTALELKMAAVAMSNMNKVFTWAAMIGPIYFVPMLFVTRLLFLLLAKWIRKDSYLFIAVLILSYIGYLLGNAGYWLPWSVDISLYCLIYYYIAYVAHKYNVMEQIKKRRLWWGVFLCAWLYVIRHGSMEIFVRNYNLYPVAIVGAVSGTVIFYFLCYFLSEKLGNSVLPFELAGKSTVYILIVHTQFEYYLGLLTMRFLAKDSLPYCLIMIVLQVLCGIVFWFIVTKIQTCITSSFQKKKGN